MNFLSPCKNLAAKEIEIALAEIRNNCDKDLNIIYGTAYNNDLGDEMIVTVIATGYELKAQNNGYDELASEIYKNVSENNSEYEGLNHLHVSDEEEPEDLDDEEDLNFNKTKEIFDIKTTRKQEKLRIKEEKRKRKEEAKSNTTEPKETRERKDFPSWLKK